MRVHFYDVGQALAALIDLPDGRHILVDAGDSYGRPFCGDPCRGAATHLQRQLAKDLGGEPLSLLWITHQHSDHIGGVPGLLGAGIAIRAYVDNGTRLDDNVVSSVRTAVAASEVPISVIDPEHATLPIESTSEVRLNPVLPTEWPSDCEHKPNDCSLALRIDYCRSSVLFLGDAEADLERAIDPGPVTLLQVGHHGSETSSTLPLLARTAPRYAVISVGKPDVGTNTHYNHPRARAVRDLTRALGGAGMTSVEAYEQGTWSSVASSDSLWVTARDGDVVLTTSGDGSFRRE